MVYVSGQISSMLGDSFITSGATIICMNDRNQLNSQLRVGMHKFPGCFDKKFNNT